MTASLLALIVVELHTQAPNLLCIMLVQFFDLRVERHMAMNCEAGYAVLVRRADLRSVWGASLWLSLSLHPLFHCEADTAAFAVRRQLHAGEDFGSIARSDQSLFRLPRGQA
jgi:hypothetical protein